MSLIDPAAKAQARAGRKLGPLPMAICAIVLLLFGVVAGYGWSSISAAGEDGDPDVAALVAIPLGMLGGIVSLIIWGGMSLRRKRFNFGTGFGLLAIGIGFGFFWTANFTDPGRADVPLLWLIGLVIFGIGALALALNLIGLLVGAGRKRTQHQVMQSGRETTAEVTDQGYVRFRESSKIITSVTFTFRDGQGLQRWVRRTMLINESAPVLNGQKSRLWYDPVETGNDKKIVVEMARNASFGNN